MGNVLPESRSACIAHRQRPFGCLRSNRLLVRFLRNHPQDIDCELHGIPYLWLCSPSGQWKWVSKLRNDSATLQSSFANQTTRSKVNCLGCRPHGWCFADRRLRHGRDRRWRRSHRWQVLRQGFNVEARKMGGHGAYLLDFDTDPPSPGPARAPRREVTITPAMPRHAASRVTRLSFTFFRPRAAPITFSRN
jgi:hypothetical protein